MLESAAMLEIPLWALLWEKLSAGMSEDDKAAQLAELRAYWQGHVPPEIPFDPDKAIALLLHNARAFETALFELGQREDEQRRLMTHREKAGRTATQADHGACGALKKVRWKAWEALSNGQPRPGSHVR